MGKTIAEKILSRTSGQNVRAGDFVNAKVDLDYLLKETLVDIHRMVVQAGLPDGLPKLANPEKIAIMLGDHQGCHASPTQASAYKASRELATKYGIKKLYDINTGIAHVAIPEEGLARPGMRLFGCASKLKR